MTTSQSRVQQQQERQQAKAQAEADLYRRAQLRTPAENAQRSLGYVRPDIKVLTRSIIVESISLREGFVVEQHGVAIEGQARITFGIQTNKGIFARCIGNDV